MTEETQVEQTEAATETPQVSDAEEVARERGWRPESEWKGDPPRNGKFFATPEEYNEHHEKSNHKVRMEANDLRGQLAAMKAELNGLNGYILKHEEKTKAEMERKILSLRDELNGAVRVGDQTKAQQIMQESAAIQAEINEPSAQVNHEQANQDALQRQFNAQNPWYDETSPQFDRGRWNEANAVAKELLDSGQPPNAMFFDEIAKRMEQKAAPAPKPAPKVESPSRVSRKAKKVTEWGQLPAEVRKNAEDAGFLRLYGNDKDKYAKVWSKEQEQSQ